MSLIIAIIAAVCIYLLYVSTFVEGNNADTQPSQPAGFTIDRVNHYSF
jgi:hypothetical protein